jgi:hypothetical protein
LPTSYLQAFFAACISLIFAAMPSIHWGEILFYAFAAVTIIQVFYYTWFLVVLLFTKSKKKTNAATSCICNNMCKR